VGGPLLMAGRVSCFLDFHLPLESFLAKMTTVFRNCVATISSI